MIRRTLNTLHVIHTQTHINYTTEITALDYRYKKKSIQYYTFVAKKNNNKISYSVMIMVKIELEDDAAASRKHADRFELSKYFIIIHL